MTKEEFDRGNQLYRDFVNSQTGSPANIAAIQGIIMMFTQLLAEEAKNYPISLVADNMTVGTTLK
jgi:hypothetical protein